jgi:hypothetical protein
MAAPLTEIQPTQLVAEANQRVAQAHACVITDQESYEEAAGLAIRLNLSVKALTEHYAEPIKKADEAHKALLESRNSLTRPLLAARDILSRKQVEYEREQKRIAEDQARQAREEANRLKMEQDEKRLEEMEAAGASPQAVVSALAEMKSMPVFAPPPVKTFVPVAGAVTRKSWVAVCVHPLEFFKAALDRQDLRGVFHDPAVLRAVNAVLSGLARASRGHLSVPGVEVEETGSKAYTGRGTGL